MTAQTAEVQAPTFKKERVVKYLKLYNADIDWEPHIEVLAKRLASRMGKDSALEQLRSQVACAILLPVYDKSAISDPPENLLFWCSSYHQFGSRDWVNELLKVWEEDDRISSVRTEARTIGIISPIEYVPITRQAYRWLVERIPYEKDTLERSIAEKFMLQLVFAYGGAVICKLFEAPEFKTKLSKIPNWRTGYFFERLINEVYTKEQILRIKEKEVAKIQKADKNLIKHIRN